MKFDLCYLEHLKAME